MTLFVHQALLDFLRRREGVFQIVRQLLAVAAVIAVPIAVRPDEPGDGAEERVSGSA
ncbi:MAG: hypothetical protein IKN00_00860 [Bacteroidales bacterium]|nr:hypothetical protein [Bacteroidales bacterium]